LIEGGQRRFDVGEHGLIVFLGRHLGKPGGLLHLPVNGFPAFHPRLEGLDFLLNLLRLHGIVPEFRIRGLPLAQRYLFLFARDVKDTPGA
jgi:hypothetical protein